jgi:acid stress-induced BolA-like protein IbaG/YrbA
MFEALEVQKRIAEGLDCTYVQIEGDDGVHFTGIVVSSAFHGLSRVRQHQAVYATLGSLMGNEIHALQLQTYTPENWETVRVELGI